MKKNTILWVAGGALLLWWLSRRNKPAGGGAMPSGGGGMAPAVMDAFAKSEAIADGVTFEVDTTTNRQLYAESQKACK